MLGSKVVVVVVEAVMFRQNTLIYGFRVVQNGNLPSKHQVMRVYFTRTMRLFHLAIDCQQRSNLKNCGDIVPGNGKVMKALKLLVPKDIL